MKLRKIVLCAAALVMSANAQASTQSYGYITGFVTLPNTAGTGTRLLIYANGPRDARPACDCCGRWEIDSTTPIGQSWTALILAAYAAHHTIRFLGTGTCVSGSNDTEGVSLISTDNL